MNYWDREVEIATGVSWSERALSAEKQLLELRADKERLDACNDTGIASAAIHFWRSSKEITLREAIDKARQA